MWKRVVWDIFLLTLALVAPWWVTFVVGIGGIVLFPWYVEIIFAGAIYDSLFGGVAVGHIHHLIHTGIFTAPLLIIEYIKTLTLWS